MLTTAQSAPRGNSVSLPSMLKAPGDPRQLHVLAKLKRCRPVDVSLNPKAEATQIDDSKLAGVLRAEMKRNELGLVVDSDHMQIHMLPSSEPSYHYALPNSQALRMFLTQDSIKSLLVVQHDPETGEFQGFTILLKRRSAPLLQEFPRRDVEIYRQIEIGMLTPADGLRRLAGKYQFRFRLVPARGYSSPSEADFRFLRKH